MKISSEIWLTTAEVADVLKMSAFSVRKQIARGLYVIREEPGNGGACRKRYLIALSSLPPDIQRQFAQDQAEQEADPLPAQADDSSSAAQRTTCTLAELESRLSDEEYRRVMDEAWQKVAICEEVIALRDDPDRAAKLATLMSKHHVSDRTLRRWVAAYEREGIDGLIHQKYRQAVAQRRVHPELIRFIKREYLQPHKPTKQHVYERACRYAEELGVPAPSRATVYRIIDEDILPGERVMGREGIEAFRKTIEPKCRRDLSDLQKNEIWTGDGHTIPVFLNFGGRPLKAVVSVWMDMRTEVVTGFCVSQYDNSQSIALALRHGILPKPNSPIQGIPAQVYTDNGKDYRSKHLAAVYASLRIDERFCTPHSPWTKPIERFFSTMHLRFSKYLPGYCGNKPEDRPEGFDEKALCRAGKLLTPEEFASRLAEWIETDYHKRRHSGLGMSPMELYESLPAARPEMPDARVLDLLLMKLNEVKIYPDGIRRFGRLFWAEELVPFIGDTVTVRYDPSNVGELVVFRRGRYLCVAKNAELLSMRATEAQVKEHIARQRRARKFFRQRLAELDAPLSEVQDIPKVVGANDEGVRPQVQMLTGLEAAARARAAAQDDLPPPPAVEKRDRVKDFLVARGDRVAKRLAKEG